MVCIVAFAGVKKRSLYNTIIAPVLGVVLNVGMLIGVIYYSIVGGGSTQVDTIIAIGFSLAWLVVGFGYMYVRKLRTGEPILHPEDHKEKIAASAPVDAMANDGVTITE